MCWILIRLNEILYGQCLRQWDGGGDVIQGNAPLSCHVWWIATQHWHLEHRKRSSTRTVLINSIPYSFKVFQSQPTRPQQTAKDRNTNKEKVDDDINDWLERIKEDINGVESQAQSIRFLNGKNISGLSRFHARRRDSDNKNYKPIPPYRYNNKQQQNKNIFRLMAQSNRWPTLVLPKKRAGLTQAKIKRKQVLRWCGALDTLTGVVAAADAFFFLFGLFVFEHFAWAFVNNWLLFKMITSDDGQDKETAQLLFEISFSFHLLCKCVCVQQERWLTRQSPSIKKRIAHVDSPISKSMFRSVADSQWPSPTFFFQFSLSLLFFAIAQSQRLHGRKTIRTILRVNQSVTAAAGPGTRSPYR